MSGELGVVRREGETGGVRFVRRYAATPAELWAALTEEAQLGAWITPRVTFEARVGGRVVFDWPDGSSVEGRVKVFEPERVLEYSWNEGKAASTVRFELTPSGKETVLVLDHSGLPLDEASGFGAGWHSHLDWLALQMRGDAAGFDQNARYLELAPVYSARV